MQMSVKLTNAAAIEPAVEAHVAANVAGEAFVFVGREEGEVEGVAVGLVEEREWHGGREDVEVDIAGGAVVGEAVASDTAGIAVEVALGVGWVRRRRRGKFGWEGWWMS